MDLDENVRVLDGEEDEEKMMAKATSKGKRLGRISKDKMKKMLPKEVRKEKEKMDEEVVALNDTYKEMFEATLEYFEVSNIRDLPEEKKKEFFAIVDEALEEAKMAKKDHDGDGKIETSTAEYMGSRDKAIKKAMKKEEVEVEEGYYKDMDTKKKEDDRLAKKPATVKLKGFGPDAAKGNMSNPAARAALMKKEEVEPTFEEMTPAQKADRLKMIARAADRVQSGQTAKDVKKIAKADMKQKGAQKGMAPLKKDVEEQVKELRQMIREGNDKIGAYKLLAKILNNKETSGEQ